ncbi:hypothetical protein AAMO2058_000605600 [Amorphochlora amoebiformis]
MAPRRRFGWLGLMVLAYVMTLEPLGLPISSYTLLQSTLPAMKKSRGGETSEGQFSKISQLDNLLLRAQAYSAFLRENLQRSHQARLKNGTESYGQPKIMSGINLRNYQVDGVQWLVSLYQNGLNGILADEMGLGKTVQVVGFISHLWEENIRGPFLIVTPLSTLGNWKREFERCSPSIPVRSYHGTPEDREAILTEAFRHRRTKGECPVILTTYEMILHDGRRFAQKSWKYLVVDEGQRLKNKDCRLLRILKTMDTGNRLLLSGTPLQNNLAELWSLLNFLLPDIFENLETFQQWFTFDEDLNRHGSAEKIISGEKDGKFLSKLHAILDPFLLRRLKSDVEIDLPPKREYVVYAQMTELQVRLSEAILNDKLRSFLKHFSRNYTWAETNPYSRIENSLIQMRKICNHPYLFIAPLLPPPSTTQPLKKDLELLLDHRIVSECGKMILLDRMLRILKENGNKVIVFCQMTRVMDIIEDYLGYNNYTYCRIDGNTPFDIRESEILRFNTDPSVFIFILSTRAGGLGINLSAGDTVIIYDSDANPQQDLQAQDRVHRIGQTQNVAVYRFITHNSVEVKIHERATRKRQLELLAINRNRFKVKDKLKGSTVVQSAADYKLQSSVSLTELRDLLQKGDRGSRGEDGDGIINNHDLRRILLERKENAPARGGQGFEVVDGATSRFL